MQGYLDCTQESLLEVLRDRGLGGCQGLNLGDCLQGKHPTHCTIALAQCTFNGFITLDKTEYELLHL